MNTLNKDNIHNFFLETQCCLADKGLDIARKLSVDNICYEDKVNFILSHIFKKIIRVYNEGDLPTALIEIDTSDSVNHDYYVKDVYINNTLIWNGVIQVNCSGAELFEIIYNKINLNELYSSEYFICTDCINIVITSSNPLDANSTQYVSFGSFIKDGDSFDVQLELNFGSSSPKYDCLDEQTMCNMINFLKNYCSSNNNCNCK